MNIDAQLNELTFKEAEISSCTLKFTRRTARCWRNGWCWKRKSKLNGRNGDAENQQEIVRLTRDAESGQQVYMQLLNKEQELKITEASTVGDVRIVDPATTQPCTETEERVDYPRPDALNRGCIAALVV